MIERQHLEKIAQKQKEINKLQSELNNEFQKYYKELFQKAREVLKWKDENLNQSFLKYKQTGHIHEIRHNSLVLAMPDTDAELPTQYYNVSFDEIYSNTWKKTELEKYKKKKEEEIKNKEKENELKLLEQEKQERAEYERLKAKYEKQN